MYVSKMTMIITNDLNDVTILPFVAALGAIFANSRPQVPLEIGHTNKRAQTHGCTQKTVTLETSRSGLDISVVVIARVVVVVVAILIVCESFQELVVKRKEEDSLIRSMFFFLSLFLSSRFFLFVCRLQLHNKRLQMRQGGTRLNDF